MECNRSGCNRNCNQGRMCDCCPKPPNPPAAREIRDDINKVFVVVTFMVVAVLLVGLHLKLS